MEFQLTEKDLRKIEDVLDVAPKRMGNNFRFEIVNKSAERKLALEIYPGIVIGRRRGTLISVYTPTAHLQLHFCTGYVVSKLLGEITFVGESEGKLSGLTIEREGGCSLYANVDRSILSGDFTTLGPEVMLSGIALSLTESILPPEGGQVKAASRRGVGPGRPHRKKTARR
ncbi:MAG TPA: hypothetical protein VMM37_03235 [Bacteroidota bacterium]|nr:hypothetical protein [Bacteroidota bacterium]